jgi:hypothetical protein
MTDTSLFSITPYPNGTKLSVLGIEHTIVVRIERSKRGKPIRRFHAVI